MTEIDISGAGRYSLVTVRATLKVTLQSNNQSANMNTFAE